MKKTLQQNFEVLYMSDANRNWLSPNLILLEKFKFEMTSIDTNDVSCPGVTFHFDTSQAGVSFRKGRPRLF